MDTGTDAVITEEYIRPVTARTNDSQQLLSGYKYQISKPLRRFAAELIKEENATQVPP